jgi:hypothetical protein
MLEMTWCLLARFFIPEGFQILAGGKRSATTGTGTRHPGGMQEDAESGIPPGCVISHGLQPVVALRLPPANI